MRKSGFGGLTHFLFLKSPHLKDLFCKQIMIEKNKTTATEIERFQWLWSEMGDSNSQHLAPKLLNKNFSTFSDTL